MRRFLIDAVDYLSGLAAAVRDGWSRFFFRPADPTPLGLIRIAVGLLAFWSLLILGLDLHAYLGSQGWADAESTRSTSNSTSTPATSPRARASAARSPGH